MCLHMQLCAWLCTLAGDAASWAESQVAYLLRTELLRNPKNIAPSSLRCSLTPCVCVLMCLPLSQVNDKAKVSVKLVAEAGIGVVASGVAKANADIIQVNKSTGVMS